VGEIINSKLNSKNKILLKLEISEKELEELKGSLRKISLFCGDLCQTDSQISQRGINGVTKYFKIPLQIRSKRKITEKISYQKAETLTKTFYIYSARKN
jgi:hypothetical protein